MPSMTGFLLA